jgi:hypothetical protein
MGMTATYRRVTDLELQQILVADARKKCRLILGEGERKIDLDHLDSEFRINHVNGLNLLCAQYAGSGGLWSDDIEGKANRIGLSEADVDRETKQRGLHLEFYLDKNVPAALHCLLTGETFAVGDLPRANNSLALAVFGGDFVPDTESIGRVRYLKPPRVKEIAAMLARNTFSGLSAKNGFDPENEFMESIFDMFKRYYLRASEVQDVVLQIFG